MFLGYRNLTDQPKYFLDLSMAIAGLLMFGDGVRDELTSNIFLTKGYPKAISVCIAVFIAIIPLTKIPLKYVFLVVLILIIADPFVSARPIFITIEILCGLDVRAVSSSSGLVGLSGYSRGLLKCTIRILTSVVIVLIAIVIPSFDSIMALMGSVMCFSICIVLPLAFYLKLFGHEISRRERIFDWFLIVSCSIMAVVGTVWVFLPKQMVGAT